jgi:aspartate/tyrosine/aromatic aminotransferase
MATNYKKDTSTSKVNLGVGAYRDSQGKPYVFSIVKKVEQEIVTDIAEGRLDKEYNPIEGDAEFLKGAR